MTKEENINTIEKMKEIIKTSILSASIGFTIGVHFTNYYISPINAKLYDINKDGELDIFYPKKFPFPARSYLQTKEKKFIEYYDFYKEKKAKIDSIYKVNPEAFKGLLERELEKEIRK